MEEDSLERLKSGALLGPYEILGLQGAGGMGRVYRARDTRLDRTVAIKVLPPDISQDPERRVRFDREAKAIAQLSHPHICTLYDVGHQDGTDFLVLELLEGTTLADRLSRGPLPVDEALVRAVEIADAVDKAHRKGILHRDIKPANVMLTKSGAKVLDFGLAKMAAEDLPAPEAATQTAPLTSHGQILGTLHYMAPEQLEGRDVDPRADLFSFGALLFEMLTGRRAFDGKSQAEVIGAILHRQPRLDDMVEAGVPPALQQLVGHCLLKDREDRWQSARDLLLQLEWIAAETGTSRSTDTGRGRTRERLAWGLAAAAGLLSAVLALALLSGGSASIPSDPDLEMVSILPSEGTSLVYGDAPQLAPDGKRIAFVAADPQGRDRLYVRELESAEPAELVGTEDARLPFWSPDSRSIGFFSKGQLKTVSVDGGPVRSIAPAPVPRGGTWNRDNMILFSGRPNTAPFLVSAAGGPARPVPVEEDFLGFRWFPAFLPDGRHYVFLSASTASPQKFRQGVIRVSSIDSAESKELVQSAASAAFDSTGFLLFQQEGTVLAQPFDLASLTLSGDPTPIAEKVGFNPITYQALFSVSGGGNLAFAGSEPGAEVVRFDRKGNRMATVAPAGDYNTLCLMPGEKQLVFELADSVSANVDIWSLDLETSRTSRLTFAPEVDFYPVCSPSSEEILFASLRNGPPSIFRLATAIPASEKELLGTRMATIPSDWSRDGKFIVYSALNPETNFDVVVWPVEGGDPIIVAGSKAEEKNGRLSPNGRWMAYASDETGSAEVYVQPFPTTGARWQISQRGGTQPQWSSDGRQLYYIGTGRKLVEVEVDSARNEFVVGETRELFDTRVSGWEMSNLQGTKYAATRDKEHFLVVTAAGNVRPISLLRNWRAKLRP